MATRRSARIALHDLPGQTDPTTPLDWQSFLAAAGPVLTRLQDDLRERAKASPAVAEALLARHADDKAAKRTGDSFVDWQDHFIEQVAAAWVLSCVFVRTLEDRGLLGHGRLAGPGAADSLKLFLELAPSLNERDYLLTIFRELTRFPATRELFDARHNPVWLLTPSADGAKALVQLFQSPRADVPAFRFGQADTGFLGWLYQDLNAAVRERYALLQTPRFVESFILDRTLEPAIAKFGLDDTTIIDPTCGSGHFLLGAFERLFDHQLRNAPGLSPREAAHLALNAVYGADINPYAVGIARFRLTMAFFEKAGFTSLATAPAVPLHVVVGDSLLHNPYVSQPDFAEFTPSSRGWRGEEFALEDEAAARDVLHRRYGAVVGNPPYIVVRDSVLRKRYAEMYQSCQMNYALTVPFMERFFSLARTGGCVGKITSNSFIKREFGAKLIENFLPTVNLELIINTSGAYIPGHGTPTVLVFGAAEEPRSHKVATVLANRGEPSTPQNPEDGVVWRSIADHWNEPGFENEFITVVPTQRGSLAQHPWSLGGGGTAELKELLEASSKCRLSDVIHDLGFSIIIGEDDVFLRPSGFGHRRRLPTLPIGVGENVRDWSLETPEEILCPFDQKSLEVVEKPELIRELWPWRTVLERRIVSGSTSMKTSGRKWFDVRRLSRDKHRWPTSITFAEVATHNHFVLDRGGKVFKQTAPIIKLPETATEDDHFALLAYLNSSTACFWMKQVCQPKGNHSAERPESGLPEMNRYAFSSTAISAIPLPSWSAKSRERLVALARQMQADADAKMNGHLAPSAVVERVAAGQPNEPAQSYADRVDVNARLHIGQRVLDALCYAAFGLIDAPHDVATDEQLLELVDAGRNTTLSLLETDTNRRLWKGTRGSFGHLVRTDQELVEEAAETWILNRIECWMRESAVTRSRKEMTIDVASDDRFVRVRELMPRSADEVACVSQVLSTDCIVPFLSALRFTSTGLDRFSEWERTWELQRREDRGEHVGEIPVPPKYGPGDYLETTFFRLRGALDVPKERFISYPGCESDQDGEPVYGWAGWDHEQRARALATLYVNRRDEESWSTERLTPMLAGLLELLPWLKQWHAAASDDYAGVCPGAYYEGFLDDECRKLSLTRDDLRAWRPATRTRAPSTATKKPKVAKAPKPEKGAWRLSDEVQLSTYAAAALEAAALSGPMASWRAIEAAIFAIDGATTMSLLEPDAAKAWKHNLGADLKLHRDAAAVRQACESALEQLKRDGVVTEEASGVLKMASAMTLDEVLPRALAARVAFVVEHVLPLFESAAELVVLRSQRPEAEAPRAQRKAVS